MYIKTLLDVELESFHINICKERNNTVLKVDFEY